MNSFIHARILRALFACFQNASSQNIARHADCEPDGIAMETQQETTLAKVRLHWGIFVPVLLCMVGLVLAVLPFLFIVHMLFGMLGQIGGSSNNVSAVPIVMWLLTLSPCVLIVAALFLVTWFAYSKSEVKLTNRRLLFRTGFLSRRSGEVPLENVESIFISEPLLGRICGYGTVTVTTVGGASFCLSFIGYPQSVHSTLQMAVLNAKDSFRGTTKPSGPTSRPKDEGSRYMPKG
jgi:membrane protein YdbS with pleckstrin-like domain